MALSPLRAFIRFYAELNDHLPFGVRYRTLEKEFYVPASVKDIIESFGIPHTEVELIVINGESSDFARLIQNGDRVAVYPMFEALDIAPELRVRPHTLRETRFVLDVHLGKLTGYLRMLGFDTYYDNAADDPELVKISGEQNRILLTRDRGLLKHAAVTRGYWVRETDSRRQVAEVVSRFDLAGDVRPFTRCMVCNHPLSSASKANILGRVSPLTAELYDDFRECAGCGRIYWEGSHHRRMQQWIAKLSAPPQVR
ncbi:MAG: Mut7-C RNAse domain-containing protein [Bryobacteraceae bacterium]